jgi:hypothetical protein
MPNKLALPKQAAGFLETMDCLPVPKLPEGPAWTYEIKLDGYRLEVVRSGGKTTLYSRRQNLQNLLVSARPRSSSDRPWPPKPTSRQQTVPRGAVRL